MANKLSITPFHVMDILARCKQMEAQGRDVIHMEIGEPDFETPTPITQAGMQALQKNLTHYTSAQGLMELRNAVSRYYLDRFKVNVLSDDIIITPGASGALQLVLTYLLQNNQSLMISDPTYPCNRNVANLVGGEVIAVPVSENSQFQLNLELVEQNWRDGISAVLVASPSNPTGTICAKRNLIEIADFLATKDSYLIVDEIYQGLTYGVENETVAGVRDNIFVLNSFSKYFGMTGWRVGWLVAPGDIITELDAIAQNTYLATSTIAQHAAIAVFSEDTKNILEQRRNIFEKRRDILCHALLELDIDIPIVPQGAFYVYADISNYSKDSFSFCRELLEKQALAITPGCDFGGYRAKRYVRFAYTIDETRIKQGVERLANYLAR